LSYLLTSMDPYATDGVLIRSETFDDEQWANLLRMASEQDVSQPNLVLDRRGELHVPDDMAKGMADALEAALHSPGAEAGVLERDTVEACIRNLRRGNVKLERTP
jgi:hypothetical protein